MPRERPPVNNEVLRWAVDESGLSPDEIASRSEVSRETVASWLSGSERPTRGQLTRLAALLRRPTTLFFLPSPPASSGLPPSLRRAVGRTERTLTANELQEVRRARRTQRLVSLLLRDERGPQVAIPSFGARGRPEQAGEALREWLGVTLAQQQTWGTPREAFNAWRDHLEVQRVLVMQLRLGSEGLRGFSLEDEYAPLIAVNTAENVSARVFTLLHEVAHLTSRTGTACLEGVSPSTADDSLERWCDLVASAALIPPASLQDEFLSTAPDGVATVDAVRRLADRFSVSLRAMAVALIRAGFASAELYSEIEERFPSSDYAKGFGRGGGQRAPQRRLSEIGPLAASLVMTAMANDRLSEREARQYLRLDGAELSELATALGDSP